jgi:hypothetical protein
MIYTGKPNKHETNKATGSLTNSNRLYYPFECQSVLSELKLRILRR